MTGRLEDSKPNGNRSDIRSDPRRVLVFAGGGAKGAYAFGCMLAFAKAKIRFKAVAGTSVGALNAILWCTNSLRSGVALWRAISFSNVYPVRFCDPRKYSPTVIRICSAAYVLCRLVWATWEGTPSPARSVFRVLLSLVFWIPSLLGFSYAFASSPPPSVGDIVRTILALILYLWFCWLCLDGSSYRRMLLLATPSGLYLYFLVVVIPGLTGHFTHSRWITSLIVGTSLCLTILFCVGGFRLFKSWFAFDKSLLASSKLRESISNIISNSKFTAPAIVTIAREQDVFDPDSPDWYTLERDAGQPPLCALWYAKTAKAWHPLYVDLSRLPNEEAIQCCLASAALPFGIVPPIELGHQRYVDGGIADNCPVYPFLNRDDIDEIFIVLLTDYKSDNDALREAGATLEGWKERRRQREVAEFEIPPRFFGYIVDGPYPRRNRPPKVIPYRTPKSFPVCRPFYPSSSLGNFMTGTLNFSGRFAQHAICRGYKDARLRLQNLGYWS
jgi:predicted acylesterase/phospholipase RssA